MHAQPSGNRERVHSSAGLQRQGWQPWHAALGRLRVHGCSVLGCGASVMLASPLPEQQQLVACA